jgi:hypothetical protein
MPAARRSSTVLVCAALDQAEKPAKYHGGDVVPWEKTKSWTGYDQGTSQHFMPDE